MKKFISALAVAIALQIVSGCVSIAGHSGSNMIEYPYYVTAHMAAEVVNPTVFKVDYVVRLKYAAWDVPTKCLIWTWVAIDTPIELVADTVYLPYDLGMWIFSDRESW